MILRDPLPHRKRSCPHGAGDSELPETYHTVLARDGETEVAALLATCVPFARNQVEVCGSYALHLLQRLHLDDLRYDLPVWTIGDVDVFVTGREFESAVAEFEHNLTKHEFVIDERTEKRFSHSLTEHPLPGNIRLIDYRIRGIQPIISIINTTHASSIPEVLSNFDLSPCRVSCVVRTAEKHSLSGFLIEFGVSSTIDVLSDIHFGVAHVFQPHVSPLRLDKYRQRGFQHFAPTAALTAGNNGTDPFALFMATYHFG